MSAAMYMALETRPPVLDKMTIRSGVGNLAQWFSICKQAQSPRFGPQLQKLSED